MEDYFRGASAGATGSARMIDVNDYCERLLQETLAATEAAGSDALRLEVFTLLIAERLAVAGEFNDYAPHVTRAGHPDAW